MAIHAITFRIEYDSDYDERWESVVNAIRKETTAEYWDETTSFGLIESGKTSAGVAESIDLNSKLDQRKDLLVVINLSAKGYTVLGKITDNDLHKLMKKR